MLVEPRVPGTRVTAGMYDALVRHVNTEIAAELERLREQVAGLQDQDYEQGQDYEPGDFA